MSSGLYSASVNSRYTTASQNFAQQISNLYAKTTETRGSDTMTAAQKRHAASILDENLTPMAVAYYNIFSTVDEIQEYIYNKYFESPEDAYIQMSNNSEKYAMFENDIYAVFYGLDENNINLNDPRINFSEEDWEKINYGSSDIDKMNAKMQEIIERNQLKLDAEAYYTITFNPYDYSVNVTDENQNTITAFANALNSSQNSKNFFLYALENSSSLNQSSVNKMYAYQNVFKYSGENLQNLRLSDGNFYTSNNENILDVIKNSLQSSFLNSAFINSEYNNTSNLLQNIAQLGWNNIPDLQLSMMYSMREGIFVPGVVYNVL